MSETPSHADHSPPAILGPAAAAFGAVSFAAVAYLLTENAAFAVALAAMEAAGMYLLVPWMVRLSAVDEETVDDLDASSDGVHPGAAGFALAGSAIVALALTMAFLAPFQALAVALALVVVEYVLFSSVLPNPER